ncbi:MAG: RdgB/HAM1 family non-canonical purine NTP pyrophosphatase [Thiohalomonadaceae bacterium]
MKKIVLASGNVGKVREFNQLLVGLGYEVVPQTELGVPEIEETGLSFVENAILKARNAAAHTGLSAIADDSGLEVDALHGAPGIYSARYAGVGASDAQNVQKLLQELEGISERQARFQCLLVWMRHAHDPVPLICQGSWEGSITRRPQGDNGFGYDPVFWVAEQACTSAQLSPEQKNAHSHRGQALRLLLQHLPHA